MTPNLFDEVKARCGIAAGVTVYDGEIMSYLEDCKEDLRASGVPEGITAGREHYPQLVTAVSLYVRAEMGHDRSDTEKYLDLYRKKVFRMRLEGGEDDVG